MSVLPNDVSKQAMMQVDGMYGVYDDQEEEGNSQVVVVGCWISFIFHLVQDCN